MSKIYGSEVTFPDEKTAQMPVSLFEDLMEIAGYISEFESDDFYNGEDVEPQYHIYFMAIKCLYRADYDGWFYSMISCNKRQAKWEDEN